MFKFLPAQAHKKEISPNQYTIRYGNRVPDDAVALAYCFTPPLTPEQNIYINDYSELTIENSGQDADTTLYVRESGQLFNFNTANNDEINTENFILTNAWKKNNDKLIPLYFEHQLKYPIYDIYGSDDYGYYQGSGINLLDVNNNPLPVSSYWAIKLEPAKINGYYNVKILTSFEATSNGIVAIYNAQQLTANGSFQTIANYKEFIKPRPLFNKLDSLSGCLQSDKNTYYQSPGRNPSSSYLYSHETLVEDNRNEELFTWQVVLNIKIGKDQYTYKSPLKMDYVYPIESIYPHETDSYYNDKRIIYPDSAKSLFTENILDKNAILSYRVDIFDNFHVKGFTNPDGTGPVYVNTSVLGNPKAKLPLAYTVLSKDTSFTPDAEVTLIPKNSLGSSLDVVFVFDNSASMLKYDQANLRTEIAVDLITSLDGYYEVKDELPRALFSLKVTDKNNVEEIKDTLIKIAKNKINYNLITFDNDIITTKRTTEGDIFQRWIKVSQANTSLYGSTFIYRGIDEAIDILSKDSPNKAIVLFTDVFDSTTFKPDMSMWIKIMKHELEINKIKLIVISFSTNDEVTDLDFLLKDTGMLNQVRFNKFGDTIIKKIAAATHNYPKVIHKVVNNCFNPNVLTTKIMKLNRKDWEIGFVQPNKVINDYLIHYYLETKTGAIYNQEGLSQIPLNDIANDSVSIKVNYEYKNISSLYSPLFSVKPYDKRCIRALYPVEIDPQESWYLRIQNGTFIKKFELNHQIFFLPEFERQNFSSEYGKPVKKVINEIPIITGKYSVKTKWSPLFVKTDINNDPSNLEVSINNKLATIINWNIETGVIEISELIHANYEIRVNYYYREINYVYRGYWDKVNAQYWYLDLNPGPGHLCTAIDESNGIIKDVPSASLINKTIYLYLHSAINMTKIKKIYKEYHLPVETHVLEDNYIIYLNQEVVKEVELLVYFRYINNLIPSKNELDQKVSRKEIDAKWAYLTPYWDWVNDLPVNNAIRIFNPFENAILPGAIFRVSVTNNNVLEEINTSNIKKDTKINLKKCMTWVSYSQNGKDYLLENRSYNNSTVFHTFKEVDNPDTILLAKIYVRPNSNSDSINLVDIRQRGGGLKEFITKEILKRNEPQSEFYWDIGYWDGESYPENAVLIIRLPKYILKEYGGKFAKQEVEEIINKHLTYGTLVIIEYTDGSPTLLLPPDNLIIDNFTES